ncbi:MAG: carbohydrate-binding family 9-like protein [Fuerstiella sp.]|nr:carbohydrate-binding family 9-like protein [Fuerstiella sp.]
MQFQTRMRIAAVVIGCVFTNSISFCGQQKADDNAVPVANQVRLTVRGTEDFELTGDGSADAWTEATWIDLNRRPNAGHDYSTRFKTLYSETGIYFLFDGTDSRLTATMQDDFDDLYLEDVFEVFLWTDESLPVYFEYEISPLDKELPILIPNFGGHFMGWRPWRYEGDRKTRTKVSINGGSAQSGSPIRGWSAEVFIPYALLNPLKNVPPKSGTKWRANVYRIDYDDKKMTQWDWARVGPSFHEYKGFGTFVFE